jgi:hypothetical protein
MAMTGKAAGVDPEAFKVIDGKLFLYFNQNAADKFNEKAGQAIEMADENWEKLKK